MKLTTLGSHDSYGEVAYTVAIMKKVLLASNNQGKAERYRNLIAMADLRVEVVTPAELGIEEIEVIEDGATLAENAEKKASVYLGKTDLPILANDTGFWLETEGFVDAPKRLALGDQDERALSKAEIAARLVSFWQAKARANGGKIDAAWVEAFILLQPDGTKKLSNARREVTLTDTIFGEPHVQMPVRALYISKITNKPAALHTPSEELEEMLPVVTSLKELLGE